MFNKVTWLVYDMRGPKVVNAYSKNPNKRVVKKERDSY